MTNKDYLKQLFWIEDEIKCLNMEREILSARLFGAVKLSDMKVQSTPLETAEDIYVEMAEYSKQISNKTAELLKLKIKISDEIDNVKDNTCRKLLRYRYTMGFNWEEVADLMGYDVRWVHRLHGRALQEFDKCNKPLKAT